jgi:serralysin
MCSYCSQAAFQSGTYNAESIGPQAANGGTFPGATGNQNVDALLSGYSWGNNALTWRIPTSAVQYDTNAGTAGIQYGDMARVVDWVAPTATMTTASTFIFNTLFAGVSGLTFTAVGASDITADLTIGRATARDLAGDADDFLAAYTYLPTGPGSGVSGDVWFSTNYDASGPASRLDKPALGGYNWHSYIHEFGHALGLKHGHETSVNGAMTSNRDSMEFSVMTYRGYIGADTTIGYQNETYGYAQTLMMYDIAALQVMYGANFTENGGNTVYTFNSATGEMSIDGVGQGTPGANRIFRTLWDGNGTDTYDLSNYTTNLDIDLTPGGWSTFSAVQTANLGDGNYARGNLFNALLFQGDVRSLIENATGGTGNDIIEGNRAGNTLTGNDGDDILIGAGGSDVLVGGTGNDSLSGDLSIAAPPVGLGSGLHAHGNIYDSVALAYNINNQFSFAANANIGNATTIPHMTLNYSDAAGGVPQYYSVTLAAGSTITLDIDALGADNFDSQVQLIAADGTTIVAFNDGPLRSDPGSSGNLNSFLTYTVVSGGVYYIRVSYYSNAAPDIAGSSTYSLHVSVAVSTETRGEDGAAGDDNLNGGLGADVLNGGGGFDLARYDTATTGIYTRLDGVAGQSGEAVGDTYISIEGLVGSAFADTFVGSNTATGDSLSGLGGGDSLYGLSGSDTLLGGAGNDNLYGGLGGDVLDGGADFDLARYDSATTGIYTRLDGVAGQFGEAVGDTYISIEGLTGSAFNDTFVGSNSGDETLYGNGGADGLYGLGGNDTLFGGAGGDVLNGGEGFDLARYDQATTGVYTRLDGVDGQFGEAVGDTYISIEGLVGSAFNDTFVGHNVDADYFFGLVGNDALYGLGGADYLDGGAGNDTLFGGAGADRFVFNTALSATTNVDTIGDFAAGSDDIVLSQAIFAGIGATLDASEFQIGTADSSADRIIYNQATGQLFYDNNGNGAGGQTLFATVTAGTVLTLADFVMVA